MKCSNVTDLVAAQELIDEHLMRDNVEPDALTGYPQYGSDSDVHIDDNWEEGYDY